MDEARYGLMEIDCATNLPIGRRSGGTATIKESHTLIFRP